MIDLRIADVDTEFAPTVRPETPVGDVAAALDGAETSAVVVLDGDSVVGLVTTSDVVSMVAGGDRPRTTREIISGPVSTVSPTETVVDAAERMHERGVRHLPVVDGDTYRGVVSAEILSPYLSRHRFDVGQTTGTPSVVASNDSTLSVRN
jgi:CBS domain-containing protein